MSERHKVLVVGRDGIFQGIYARLYRIDRYVVAYAKGIDEAENSLDRERPDLVVVDHTLSDGIGESLVNYMKSRPRYDRVKTLGICKERGQGSAFTIIGIDEFLEEPSDREIVEAIDRILGDNQNE
jgi:DNA-binding NtrC family response regulator